MYRDYEREEQTIKDVQKLIRDIEQAKSDMSMYCEIMKELFLSTSGKN